MRTKKIIIADTDPTAPQKAYDFNINKVSPIHEGQLPFGMVHREETTSKLPGDKEKNPDYKKLHPRSLRLMYDAEKDPITKKRIWKTLKEWARQYSDSLINPYKYDKYFADIANDYDLKDVAEKVALRFAEVNYPQRNLFYYQDNETTQNPNIADGYLEPTVGDSNEIHNIHQLTYPRKFEQNRPENPPWSEGDLANPYRGMIPEDLAVLEGHPQGKKGAMNFFDNFVWCEEDALDQLFTSKKASIKKTAKITKVADLNNFIKVGENLLVHKSEKDLWALETDDNGNFFISRLFGGNQVG